MPKAKQYPLKRDAFDLAYAAAVVLLAVVVWLAFGLGDSVVFLVAFGVVYYIGNRASHPKWHAFVRRSVVVAYLLGHRDER